VIAPGTGDMLYDLLTYPRGILP